MLTIVLGTDWKSNREYILNLISDDVRMHRENVVFMVPESVSHDTERKLCEIAGDTTSRYAEVLSFPRLATRVGELAGRGSFSCMDSGGRVVAMAAAAVQLHSKLKAYAAVETRPEFLTGMLNAVDEFKRCCISARDLANASRKTEGSLAQKLEELSYILDAYDGICSHGKRDPRDQMTWLLEQLRDCAFAQQHTFYVDGFPDFTRQHFAILQHLIEYSDHVVVGVNCDDFGSSNPAFETAAKTATELVSFARNNDIPVEILRTEPQNPSLHKASLKLFSGSITASEELSGVVETLACGSIAEEVNEVVERIQERIREGARYREIGIVCTDMSTYGGQLRMACARRNIPIYISGMEDVLDLPVINTTLAALDAAIEGLEQKAVLRYLKSALSPLSSEICDLLENYVIQWNITGKRWTEKWNAHPGGLAKEFDDASKELLARLNDARMTAIAPLARLRDRIRNAVNLKEQITALYHFIDEIVLGQRLLQMAQQKEASGEHRYAQILSQLWDILIGAFEQLHDVLGNSVWEPEAFTRLLRLLLSQYDVGTIPTVLDAVTAGPVSAMCVHSADHLYVLGAEEWALPSYSGSVGVLTDHERVALRKLGVPLTGGALEGLQAELASIFGAFCGARTSITVSCPSAQKSFVFRRLAELTGGEVTKRYYQDIAISNQNEVSAFLVRVNQAKTASDLGVADTYQTLWTKSRHELGSVSEEGIRGIYGKTLYLSASQVDKQADCRMAYFLRYGVRAKERKPYTVDPAEFGTYVHDVLEKTGAEVKQLGGFRNVSLDKTLEIATRNAQEYAQNVFADIDSDRLKYLFRRNNRELVMVVTELWEEMQNCLFDATGFEVAFGKGQEMDAIAVPGSKMDALLRGFVDRVDTWNEAGQNYFRVVDYKTGRKDFDYCDVFNGLGLQMLLYLFALEGSGEEITGNNAIASGVLYFPARVPMISTDGVLDDEAAIAEHKKAWKRKGLILNDDMIIHAMETNDVLSRLCCSRKKDGSISGDIASVQQMRMLKAYVFALVGKMVDDIASGCVEANPYTRGSAHNACAFCPYGAICHPNQVDGRRNYQAMNAQRFWDEVEKEVSKHG